MNEDGNDRIKDSIDYLLAVKKSIETSPTPDAYRRHYAPHVLKHIIELHTWAERRSIPHRVLNYSTNLAEKCLPC